jgi:hypothetical protein
MPANPDAIAWYLQRSEALLDDLRERAISLRIRGGQLAGFSGAVLALAGANVASVLDALDGIARGYAGMSLLIGVLLLVASLVMALKGSLVPRLVQNVSAEEVSNYTSERFTCEPELWRVHLRTIRSVLEAIESTTIQGDRAARAARAVRTSEYLFLTGLFSVGIALGILITEVML